MPRALSPRFALGALLVAGPLLLTLAGTPQVPSSRIVRGQVLDENNKPVRMAIVYLTQANTKKQWSVVTDKEGRYQFNDVNMKADYKIHAEWRRQKSRARSISQFDTRPLVTVNLRLKPAKKSEEKEEQKEEKRKD